MVVVVWGEAYIERFARLALPSLLAPGNLPALAAATGLEAVIMTTRESVERFGLHAAFQRLRRVCPVSFVAIDDLVAPHAPYGVVLTLAFARAVINCGADMVNTHFVFMLADFVLAEGSLRALSKYIRAGRSIVLGPSLRAAAAAVEPALLAAVNRADHTLTMAPRELVRLALEHPHPTTVAKTMNQTMCRSLRPNQLFWRVDEHTLLGRYFLVFPLCLKPERVVTSVNSYCDYGFIPEMCPSGDEVMMGDSDEFFMLELQRCDQEEWLVRLGPPSERRIARDLARWTTAEQRRAAGYDIVFHARDVPQKIEHVKAQANDFVERLLARLPPPKPHAFHRFWVGGVWYFKLAHWQRGSHGSPPELEWGWPLRGGSLEDQLCFARYSAISLLTFHLKKAATLCGLALFGQAPFVSKLHPRWPDWQLLQTALKTIRERGSGPVLVATNAPHLVEPLLPPGSGIHLLTLQRLVPNPMEAQVGPLRHALIHLHEAHDKELDRASLLLARCRTLVGEEGTCQLLVQFAESVKFAQATEAQFRLLQSLVGWQAEGARILAAGSRIRQFLFRVLRTGHGADFKSRLRAFTQTIALLPVFCWMAVLSLLGRSAARNGLHEEFSSLLVTYEEGVARASLTRRMHSTTAQEIVERSA